MGGAAVAIILFALGCFCIRRRRLRYGVEALGRQGMKSHNPRIDHPQYFSPGHPAPIYISPAPAEVEDTSYNPAQHGAQHVSMEPKYDPAMRHYRNVSGSGQNPQDSIWSQHTHTPTGSPHLSQQSPRSTTLSPAMSEPAELSAGSGRPPMQMYPSYGSNGQRPWTPGREGHQNRQYI